MLLDDFNLHYLLWGNIALSTQHYAADKLINLTTLYNFKLVTSQDLVTRFFNKQKLTLDLIFLSLNHSQCLVSCAVEFSLNYESDHLPIYIICNLQMISEPEISTQCEWKNIKVDAVFAKAQLLNILAQLHIIADINLYSLYISQFTSDVISKTVSLYKSSDRAALW